MSLTQADLAAEKKKTTPWAIVERRSTMLRLLDANVDLTAIVVQLSARYGKKPGTIYKDFQTIKEWGPNYAEMMRSADQVWVYHNELVDFITKGLKEQAITGDNSNAKVGAYRLLIDLAFKSVELSQSMGITARVPTGIEVSGRLQTEVVNKSGLWLDALTEDSSPEELEHLLKRVARLKTAAEGQ